MRTLTVLSLVQSLPVALAQVATASVSADATPIQEVVPSVVEHFINGKAVEPALM